MEKIVRDRKSNLHYSLHDAHIRKITIKKNDIIFKFDHIFKYSEEGIESRVPAKIKFKNVDFDFCDIYIMSMDKNYAKFKGKRWNFKKFIKKYPKVDMEVITETYNYYDTVWKGYFYTGKKMKEFHIGIWNYGDMMYQIDESSE